MWYFKASVLDILDKMVLNIQCNPFRDKGKGDALPSFQLANLGQEFSEHNFIVLRKIR